MLKKICSIVLAAQCCFLSSGNALAYTLPPLHPKMLPQDEEPAPEVPMRKQTRCKIQTLSSPVTSAPKYINLLGIDRLWHLTMGKGQLVGIISTGVTPNPRVSVQGAGDFVEPNDNGLSDCDGDGSLAASIIASRPSHNDGFLGIAPLAKIVSLRMFSTAYSFENYQGKDLNYQSSPILDPNGTNSARMIRYLARAIVHLANKGVQTILSPSICIPAVYVPNLGPLQAAIHYATNVKGVVVVAASSPNIPNLQSQKCDSNPPVNYNNASDVRNWRGVQSLSIPSMFPNVLSVGWTDSNGQLYDARNDSEKISGNYTSLAGPWVSVSAPGTNIVGLGIHGKLVNSYLDQTSWVSIKGSYYSAAIVAGSVALLRSRHPLMTVSEVINALSATAHNGALVDNSTGYGLIDPLAANYNFRAKPPNIHDNSRAINAFDVQKKQSEMPKYVSLVGSLILIFMLFFVWIWYSMSKKENKSS